MNLPGFVAEGVLGRGAYGQVYKAKRVADGVTYAVKVVNLNALKPDEIETSVNEIRLMASFTSPFIIRFYDSFCNNKRLYIVTEYARIGDLAHLIDEKKRQGRPFKEEDIWRFLIQLLEGLDVLHSRGVVHRDLKAANILIAAPDLIKIADLGVATVLYATQLARTQIGTPEYIAPEIWRKKKYGRKCDIWSLGVLLYEMMTFDCPFTGRNCREIAHSSNTGSYRRPSGYSSDMLMVLRRLLQVSPALRPNVPDLLAMQCIASRRYLVSQLLDPETPLGNNSDPLLSAIKLPRNLCNVQLPSPSYLKNPAIVKPLEERIHVKDRARMRNDIANMSSPELKQLSVKDLWSPTKNTNQIWDPSAVCSGNQQIMAISARPIANQKVILPDFPEEVHGRRQPIFQKRPQFKRPRIQ
jgi:NIMA (never in mitosis gene a)-related kinase